MTAARIRVLVVDDHPVVREGLGIMLETDPGLSVVGSAASGDEALAIARAARPDVVLLDLEMPGGDGIETLGQLRALLPDARVIVFTAFDTDERLFGAMRAGARGYLLKGAPRQQLFDAIRTVHTGGTLFEPILVSRLLERVGSGEVEAPLSPREQEVLDLMAKGLQNREIARQLAIGERTVKFHVRSIFTKLDVTNRTEAVSVAIQRGMTRS